MQLDPAEDDLSSAVSVDEANEQDTGMWKSMVVVLD